MSTLNNTSNQGPIQKYKVVFLGDQSVGKTSIINRFMFDNFTGNEQPTVGIDFISKTMNIDNKTVRLQLWDTAGQERFRSLIPSYIRDSQAAIVVFDVCANKTFSTVQRWIEDVKEERGTDVQIYLIANKIDIEDKREVTEEQAKPKAEELGAKYYEVSAKSGAGVTQFFKNLAADLSGNQNQESVVQQLEKQGGKPIENKENLKLQDQDEKPKNTGCC